jgi:adenine nucleotide transporter 17
MSTTTKSTAGESTQPLPATAAAQQSDNVAHALAGAGGGLLSMAVTYAVYG